MKLENKARSLSILILTDSQNAISHHDIDSPEGIAVDKHGFVYTISRGIDSIVVVSPDGKTCKTILSEADGINFPVAIDIHREKGMMIMSSKIKEIGGKNVVGLIKCTTQFLFIKSEM
ncbi:Hypothetical predicted protein [Mytilus galloprovincialis]|uniref:SMP-30/Gluconolactonase/LRE-like region domain-containing protein n=1 Tax=Mytilus galloprovincialis TaxID=29158 RepID=A0A8B6GBZ9_MYTGA|nr:Hypothetical predicted protein [Mytilus galloprovincialis]